MVEVGCGSSKLTQHFRIVQPGRHYEASACALLAPIEACTAYNPREVNRVMHQAFAAQHTPPPMSAQFEQYEREVAVVRGLIFALQPYALIVVASPDSLFAARLFANLYERRFGVLTRCCGFEEMLCSLSFLASNAVLILGLEPETQAIKDGLQSCLEYEPRKTGVILRRGNTGLREITRRANGVAWAEIELKPLLTDSAIELAAILECAFFGSQRAANVAQNGSAGSGVSRVESKSDRGVRDTDDLKPSAPIAWRSAAIRRKARALGIAIDPDETSSSFLRPLDDEMRKLNRQEFRALVVDYDGTLWCPPDEGRVSNVLAQLEPLLRNGIVIGIATGRDARLANELMGVFDSKLQEYVWLGTSNGTKVGRIEPIEDTDDICTELQPLKAALEADPILRHVATLAWSRQQLTIAAKRLFPSDALWHLAQAYARRSGVRGIQVVTSTHSVDILAPGASKLNLLNAFRTLGISRDQILCIGDQGRWPGNDFDLLEHDFALSVDEPSPCLSCGWNLAPPGCRGPAAASFYLHHTIPTKHGYFRLNLPDR